jgi:hypothetical protein
MAEMQEAGSVSLGIMAGCGGVVAGKVGTSEGESLTPLWAGLHFGLNSLGEVMPKIKNDA